LLINPINNIQMNNFTDKNMGKESEFCFPNSNGSISGIFSYADVDGIVWNGLVPSTPGNTPKYHSREEAMDAFFKDEYAKGWRDKK
jgi:hypothetical protein